jgi:hypothetical protein
MPETLDINEIEQSATARIEIAKKAKELAALVGRVFPGYGVYIERRGDNDAAPRIGYRRDDLSSLPAVEQVETVLRDAKAPMQKQDLLNEIRRRGGNVSENTLSIYLSRYDRFVSHGKGTWWVDRNNYSNGSEIFQNEKAGV